MNMIFSGVEIVYFIYNLTINILRKKIGWEKVWMTILM